MCFKYGCLDNEKHHMLIRGWPLDHNISLKAKNRLWINMLLLSHMQWQAWNSTSNRSRKPASGALISRVTSPNKLWTKIKDHFCDCYHLSCPAMCVSTLSDCVSRCGQKTVNWDYAAKFAPTSKLIWFLGSQTSDAPSNTNFIVIGPRFAMIQPKSDIFIFAMKYTGNE